MSETSTRTTKAVAKISPVGYAMSAGVCIGATTFGDWPDWVLAIGLLWLLIAVGQVFECREVNPK